MSVQTMLLARHSSARDRFVLFLSASAGYFGMRQVIVFSRALAIFQVRSRRGRSWRPEEQQPDHQPATGELDAAA